MEKIYKRVYLSLNKQTKWFRKERNFEIGGLVVISWNANIWQSQWPLRPTLYDQSNWTTKQFNDSSYSIFMVARKVVLNTSCFHEKVTLIYYKRTRNDSVVSLLQLLRFLFLALYFLSNESFEIYRHFSNVFLCFINFTTVISFKKIASLYHWVQWSSFSF